MNIKNENNLIQEAFEVEVERNRFGAWTHPEVTKYLRDNGLDTYEILSSDDWEELKRYFNIGTGCLSPRISCLFPRST